MSLKTSTSMIRILIVEDDKDVARIIERFLSPITHEKPIVAYNMEQAMSIIDSASPVDIVTLDLSLPDSFADDTVKKRIKRIKEKQPNCLLLVLTGARAAEFEAEAMKQGADAFIDKEAACRSPKTFFGVMGDVVKSLMGQPVRYQKNLPLLEKVTERICDVSKTQPLK